MEEKDKSLRSYHRQIRWRYSLTKGALVVRCGLFGVGIYWGSIGPALNNVFVTEKRWGVIAYPILRVVPGAMYPCLRWMKTKVIEDFYA